MDVGGATRWSMDQVVPRAEMIERLERRFGPIRAIEDETSANGPGSAKAPADRFALPDGAVFGIISSTTAPFCRTCDRARLTPDGRWLLCLYASDGVDLKRLLRGGAPRAEIAQMIAEVWRGRRDRGAEELFRGAARIMALGGSIPPLEQLARSRAERQKLASELEEAIKRIQETGCVIKDLDVGLIDFPSLRGGEEVYLCWKLGEERIGYYHGIDEGFAGRKPLDDSMPDAEPPSGPQRIN